MGSTDPPVAGDRWWPKAAAGWAPSPAQPPKKHVGARALNRSPLDPWKHVEISTLGYILWANTAGDPQQGGERSGHQLTQHAMPGRERYARDLKVRLPKHLARARTLHARARARSARCARARPPARPGCARRGARARARQPRRAWVLRAPRELTSACAHKPPAHATRARARASAACSRVRRARRRAGRRRAHVRRDVCKPGGLRNTPSLLRCRASCASRVCRYWPLW